MRMLGGLMLALLLLFVVVTVCRQMHGQPSGVGSPLMPFDLYVINLDRAQGRLVRFVENLRETDLPADALIRMRAVDGAQIQIEDHVSREAFQEIKLAERNGYRQRHYELTRGAVGCFLSHMEVWERLRNSDKEYIMVCEDDARLDADIGARVTAAVDALPHDWDLLLLGYWCVRCDRQQGWKKMSRFFGLHCYLIRQKAVGKIQAYAGDRVSQQVDSMLSDMCTEGRLEVFGVDDKAAVQTGNSTSVQLPLKKRRGVDPWAALPAVRAIRSLSTA